MRQTLLSAALPLCLLMLGGCGSDRERDDRAEGTQSPGTGAEAGADSMASRDPAPGETITADLPDPEERPVMQAQVVLERLGFGTGIIDGEPGPSFANALKGFQESRGPAVSGELDAATRQTLARWNNIPATRVVTIPQSWGAESFALLPEGMAEQAKVARLGYESMAEKLAERFHTTPAVLARLNPGGTPAGTGAAATPVSPPPSGASTIPAAPRFTAGQQVRVPNVGADAIEPSQVENKDWLATLRALGVGTSQPDVARIVVDESEGWLKAYDGADRLVAMFTITTGSEHDPLPIGDWQVKGVAYNPPFAFDPALFWDVPDSEPKQQLPPGPNSPVGVVWIDLTKEHYGIHGTPEPAAIGRSESHGCVRLTNWDAARLALMVSGRTKVEFRS